MSATGSGTVWWLENPLAEVAGTEEAVWSARPECGEKAPLSDAAILGFVNHSEVERHVFAVCKLSRQSTEQPSVSDEASGLQLGADASKHRPEHGTLRLRQSGFSA
jgi:hypothetical protein